MDDRIYKALEAGEPLEVSTGIFGLTEKAEENAVFNGVSYSHVLNAMRPDHLAVLPDLVGACSLSDGCGLMVNTKDGSFWRQLGSKLLKVLGLSTNNRQQTIENELSHNDIRQMLSMELRKNVSQADPSVYVCEVYDDFFIYEAGYDKSYKLSYTKTDTGVELGSEGPLEVVREVSYVSVTGNSGNTQEENGEVMAVALNATEKKSKVDYLIANCECWKKQGSDKILNSLPDDQLTQLQATTEAGKNREEIIKLAKTKYSLKEDATYEEVVAAMNSDVPVVTTPVVTPVVAPVTTPVPVVAASRLTTEEQELLGFAKTEMTKQKTSLVHRLTANVGDPAKKQAHIQNLSTKGLAELQSLVELLPPVAPVYDGQFSQADIPNQPIDNADDEDFLPLPGYDAA